MLRPTLAIALALAPAASIAARGADPFQRFELEGGARLAVMHVAGAPRQSLFVLLPMGLLHDDAERAQHAHLLEHMLIRSVDPEGYEVEGVRINGETTAGTLRLEALAPPASWELGLEHVARWLAARSFDERTLEREQALIEAEVQATLASGHVHKWAQAAWAQVVLHGRADARVRGDVAGANVAGIEAYARERISLGPGALVIAVGPIAPADVARAVRAHLASLARAEEAPPAARPAFPPASLGERSATWDLPAHHYLEWYALPSADPSQRAAAWVLARRVQEALFTTRELGAGRALAELHALPGGARLLMIQVSLSAESELAAASKAIRDVLKAVSAEKGSKRLATLARDAAGELSAHPDFARLRASLSGSPAADFIEAQFALNLASLELSTQLSIPALARAAAALTGDELHRLAREHLAPSRRSMLLLHPSD